MRKKEGLYWVFVGSLKSSRLPFLFYDKLV
jgi:hypothetical protein